MIKLIENEDSLAMLFPAIGDRLDFLNFVENLHPSQNAPSRDDEPTSTGTLPKTLNDMIFPNAFNDKLKFFNELLHKIYTSTAADATINVSVLKEYFLSKRGVIWKFQNEVSSCIKTVENLFDKDHGMYANAANLNKYMQYPKYSNEKDPQKCQKVVEILEMRQGELDNLIKDVVDHRSKCFDVNNYIRRKHFSAEVGYYDEFLIKLRTSLKKLTAATDATLNTLKMLHGRYGTKTTSVNKKSQRTIKEQRHKHDVKRKQRAVMSANKISQLLTRTNIMVKHPSKGVELLREVTNEEFKGFNKIKLSKKMHLTGLRLLCQKKAFGINNERAESMLSVLELPVSKQKSVSKTKSTTDIASWFQATDKKSYVSDDSDDSDVDMTDKTSNVSDDSDDSDVDMTDKKSEISDDSEMTGQRSDMKLADDDDDDE